MQICSNFQVVTKLWNVGKNHCRTLSVAMAREGGGGCDFGVPFPHQSTAKHKTYSIYMCVYMYIWSISLFSQLQSFYWTKQSTYPRQMSPKANYVPIGKKIMFSGITTKVLPLDDTLLWSVGILKNIPSSMFVLWIIKRKKDSSSVNQTMNNREQILCLSNI